MTENTPSWLTWFNEIQSIAQVGLAYCKDPYCHHRYEKLQHIIAEIAANYMNINPQSFNDLLNKQYGYATPKLDCRAVIFDGDRVLLVQERDDMLWSLPGGWADVNYSPKENVEREVFEESGYYAKAIKLLALYDKLKHDHPPQFPHTYKCFFLCEVVGGNARPSEETAAVGFFPVDELPSLSTHRVTEAQIGHFFQLRQQSNAPTEFD